MSVVLVDSSCIVSWLDAADRDHARCAAALEGIGARLVTVEPVIVEACYLLREVPGAPEAVLENVRVGAFGIPFTLTAEAGPVQALMGRYRSVPMDLADACLVRLAEIVGSGRILTLDSDFHVYRWRRRRPFDILV